MPRTFKTVTGPVLLPNGTVPINGRIIFTLSSWDKEANDAVYVPGPLSVLLDSQGNFSCELFSNNVGANSTVYRVSVIHGTDRETVVETYISTVALSGTGTVKLSNLPLVPEWTPNSVDVLAQLLTARNESVAAALTASTAATAAGGYAMVNFATHADALAYVAGGGSFSSGRLYSIAGTMYVGRTGASYISGLPGLSSLPVGLTLRNNTGHYVHLTIGQSWPIGADAYTTGALWAVNSKVQVWSPNLSGSWGAPIQYEEPFNENGSVCWPIEMLNRLSEEWPLNTRLYLNAKGGASITEWVGTPANRTVSEANRPMWVKLLAMIAGGGSLPDSMSFHQSVGDHLLMDVDQWVSEVNYLISQLTAEGIITRDTPILVVEGPNSNTRATSNGLSSNSYRIPMMVHGLRGLGDPRIRIVGTNGLPAPYETLLGGDTFAGHFSDAGSRLLGRERAYDALISAIGGAVQPPADPGVERSKTKYGMIGFHLRRTQLVSSGTYTVLEKDMNGVIEAVPGTTLLLPDFSSNVTGTSGLIGGDHGMSFTFIPRSAGTYTFSVAGDVTMIGCGPLSTTAITTFSYVVGANEADIPILFRWADGANWHFFPLGQVGPRPMKWVSSIDLPSIAAGATTTVTLPVPGVAVGTPIQVGRPSAWRAWSIDITDVYVATVGVLSIEVTNNSGIVRDVGNVGIIATGVI
jgi:hypothetical protein